jgi:predicted ATPase
MPWYAITGAPGAGKTAMLRLLEDSGYAVVEEAATDVIALEQARGQPEPWTRPEFIDVILELQQRRERGARGFAGPVFFDRSPLCTLALSRFLGYSASRALLAEVEQMAAGHRYEQTVFFVRLQGFLTATAARRISLAESLTFEKVHEETYREFGFRLVDVPAGPLADRVASVLRRIKE